MPKPAILFRRVLRRSTIIIVLAAATAPSAGPGQESAGYAASFAALREQDERVLAIGDRLTLANVSLCRDRAARLGLQLHDIAQYQRAARDAARRYFGFATPIAVEAIVPGGAAARAGVRAGDGLVAIEGQPLAAAGEGGDVTTARMIAASDRLVAAAANGSVTLGLLREGQRVTVTVTAPLGCATRFEVADRDRYDAQADGATVQVSDKLVAAVTNDDELAFVVGHELGHNILRHRVRLEAAGIKRGMLEAFGSSVGYIRRSEIEADMLGAVLTANAGYDPDAPARFWRWFGPAHFASILLARTHPKWSLRVKLLDREAAAWRAAPERPWTPPILAERDKPMSNDWPALVAGL